MFRTCFFGLVFVNTSRVENYKFKTRAYPIYFVVSIVARKRNIEMKNRMIQTSSPKHCQQKGTIVISHQYVQTLVAISSTMATRQSATPLCPRGEHQKSICAVHCGDSPAPHTASWLPVTSAATRPRLRSGHGGTHGGAGEEAHQRSQRCGDAVH